MATQRKPQRHTGKTRLGSKTASYLLRLTPQEKAELEAMADAKGVTLADALRVGARQFLEQEAA